MDENTDRDRQPRIRMTTPSGRIVYEVRMSPEICSTTDLPAEFREQIEQAGMAFDPQPGLMRVAPKPNDRVAYHCAVARHAPNLEIRFHIVSLKRPPPPEGFTPIAITDMNAWHDMHLRALIHNVADRIVSGPNPLPPDAVYAEFGADRGTVSRLALAQCAFSDGFNECLLLALHREDVADAYVFFMFERFEEAAETIQSDFYTLTFAKTIGEG